MSTEREIRILHVIETLDVGGAEIVVANIVNNMLPPFYPAICCLIRKGPVAARIRSGIEIIELGKAMEGNDYCIPFRLAEILRSLKIDIVHSHDWGTLLETAAAATLAGTVAVHMVHGSGVYYSRTDPWGFFKSKIRRVLERVASIKLHRAIAVSEIVRQELVENIGISSAKVVLIHNGINLVTPPLQQLTVKRVQLGLSSDDIVLITVGRLAAIKNYPLLLEALAHAVKRAPALKLVMVGDGSERAKLEVLVSRLGMSDQVRFLGERKDVCDCLALSDIFALPSFYEGISIALLEAMAAGLPAVVTRVGGNPEVIIDGENGFLVESGDVMGFASALTALARSATLRKRMGLASRSQVEAKFDLRKTIRKYEDIYLEKFAKVRY